MSKPIASTVQGGIERVLTTVSLVAVLCFLWPLAFVIKRRRAAW